MAEDTNGSAHRAQKAAESAILQVAARLGIVVLMTICLPFGAWLGTRVVGAIDRVSEQIGEIKLDITGMKKDIDYLKDKR